MSGDVHQCPGPLPTCETSDEYGSLQHGHVSENINRSTAVIPQVSTVDLGTSIEFAGISTIADISADLMTMGDATILSVIGTRRGDGSGRAAGGCLPGMEAGCSGRGPMEVAAGTPVSLGLGSGLGREVANLETGGSGSDLGQMVTNVTQGSEGEVKHESVVTGVVWADGFNRRINKAIIKHRKWKVFKTVNNSRKMGNGFAEPPRSYSILEARLERLPNRKFCGH
ncbi:hypothetical protein GJAV_G00044220 [Gymnothorax javanicus]|nr:hypothetical protein GJAV_G00044220 [Gymnothorax javanicus]